MIAEKLILEANSDNFKTVAIRPSGIFGPREVQGWKNYIEAGKEGKRVVIGNGKNIFDWTFVQNVAYAHILASDQIDKPGVAGEVCYWIRAFQNRNGD